MVDLYPAQLDGFAIELETIDDTFEKAIIRHEYPYKNGALLEDMGEKARVVRFRCYFWDDGADHATYDDHLALLDHLADMAVSELVHPKYGPMRGGIESLSVRHDERDRTAEIEVVFVEGLIEDAQETRRDDVQAAAEEAYNTGISEQMQTFADDVRAELGTEASPILALELDPELGIVEQFTAVTTTARNYLITVETYVGQLEGTLNTIANPANSLVSIINYGTSLPGRVVGSVARCVERYALSFAALRDAPANFCASMAAGLGELAEAGGAFEKTTTIGAAGYTALQLATIYKEDMAVRTAQIQSESVPVFDAMGNYQAGDYSAADSPAMTVRDLEQSLAVVRTMLQEAVTLSRDNSSIKRQALLLQNHVSSIKQDRENIIVVELDNAMPLHLLCLRYGLPYNAAERLLMINTISQPNEVSGEVLIYAS